MISVAPAIAPSGAAEHFVEVVQAVIPVVVARQGEEVGLERGNGAAGLAIGIDGAFLVGVVGRVGIDLVAAHDQDLAAWCLAAVERQRVGRKRLGDGKGRVPAVAEVGDIVDPDVLRLAALAVVVGAEVVFRADGIEVRLDLPIVDDPADRGRRHRTHAGTQQHERDCTTAPCRGAAPRHPLVPYLSRACSPP